jgi:hypothetical protein
MVREVQTKRRRRLLAAATTTTKKVRVETLLPARKTALRATEHTTKDVQIVMKRCLKSAGEDKLEEQLTLRQQQGVHDR